MIWMGIFLKDRFCCFFYFPSPLTNRLIIVYPVSATGRILLAPQSFKSWASPPYVVGTLLSAVLDDHDNDEAVKQINKTKQNYQISALNNL